MNRLMTTSVVLVAVATLASACGKAVEPAGPQPSNSPTRSSGPAAPSAPEPEPTSETPTPEPSTPELSTSSFGSAADFTQDDNPFRVTVGAPIKAKCHYSIGCDKPETGDRIVNVPITFKNTGSVQLEVSGSMFVLEFADGTRMEAGDGPTYQYGPDNTLGYGQKIRPGGTLKTSLTFEAPSGKFSIILLSNSFDGDDLHIWQ